MRSVTEGLLIILKDVGVGYVQKLDQKTNLAQQKNGNMSNVKDDVIKFNTQKNELADLGRKAFGESFGDAMPLNGKSIDQMCKNEAINKFNAGVERQQERFDKYEKDREEAVKQSHIENFDKLEIRALYEGVLVKPYSTNPFQQIKKEGALITDLGGLTPEFLSREDGQTHQAEEFIRVGIVVDAGPLCKYVQEGDTVFWRKPSETLVPFFKQDLYLVNEHSLIANVNIGLTERYNNITNE